MTDVAQRLLRRLSAPQFAGIVTGAALALAPLPAQAQMTAMAPALAPALAEALAERGGDLSDLRQFYAARGWRPLWINQGRVISAAETLLDLIHSSKIDGIKPKKARENDLRKALDRAGDGDRGEGSKASGEDLIRAELAASRALIAYVQLMRKAPRAEMTYASPALAPGVPTAGAVLAMAARAPSLAQFVEGMGWMHPFYAPLRKARAAPEIGEQAAALLDANLQRVRALSPMAQGRAVLVDAAGARLWMLENGRTVGTMRVVVGKPEMPTPMLAGFLGTALLNPYWNIPPDLVRLRIAPNVLDHGTGYLKAKGYQVLSDWENDATVVDPASVDWQEVAMGAQDVRVRQLPGGDNFMGRVKFMFPNTLGIYLHDTPEKALMKEDERQFSSGCVRLEDAPRLGRWLLGKPLPRAGKEPEQRVDLPEPVPVYITYLTAAPTGDGTIAFRPDVYGRDAVQFAARSGSLANARR